jgi:hypothetical protein
MDICEQKQILTNAESGNEERFYCLVKLSLLPVPPESLNEIIC